MKKMARNVGPAQKGGNDKGSRGVSPAPLAGSMPHPSWGWVWWLRAGSPHSII